jgi:RNA polymerase sigma factor (sigma-70 family)
LNITHLTTDEQIMEAVKNGELQQASVLFDRYHKQIFNFLRQLSNDRMLAEDLTQNVFLRLIRYRNSYRDGHRFQSWIYQMARNVFADHYQSNKNKAGNYVDVEKMSDQISDAEENHDEREELLHRSMAKLSDEHRELLVLTRFQHLKYEEVAAIMDTTVANIKVKVHRAIGKLREHYFEMEKS